MIWVKTVEMINDYLVKGAIETDKGYYVAYASTDHDGYDVIRYRDEAEFLSVYYYGEEDFSETIAESVWDLETAMMFVE